MEQLDFERWWREFMSNHQKDNDNGLSLISELDWTINGFSDFKRIAFIDDLLRHDKKFYAYHLIPRFGNEKQKVRLRRELIKSMLFREISDENVIAIIKSYKQTDKFLLRCYFQINKDFNSDLMYELFIADKAFFIDRFRSIIRKTAVNKIIRFYGLFDRNDVSEFVDSHLNEREREKLKMFLIRFNDWRPKIIKE